VIPVIGTPIPTDYPESELPAEKRNRRITSPVLQPEVEPEVGKKTVNISEPKPPSPLRRKPRALLE
jgi:hypothetical protein